MPLANQVSGFGSLDWTDWPLCVSGVSVATVQLNCGLPIHGRQSAKIRLQHSAKPSRIDDSGLIVYARFGLTFAACLLLRRQARHCLRTQMCIEFISGRGSLTMQEKEGKI